MRLLFNRNTTHYRGPGNQPGSETVPVCADVDINRAPGHATANRVLPGSAGALHVVDNRGPSATGYRQLAPEWILPAAWPVQSVV